MDEDSEYLQNQNMDKLLDDKAVKSNFYKVEKYRFVIVGLFCLNIMINLALLNVTSAIGNGVTSYYSISELILNEGPAFTWLGTLIGTPPSIWVIDKYGMRTSIIIYSIMCTTAAGLNLLINISLPASYYFTFASSLLFGISTPFLVSLVNKIGAVWFFPKDIPSVTMFIMFFWFNPGGLLTIIPAYLFSDVSATDVE